MQATVTAHGPDVVVLSLRGDLDTDTAPTLRAALDRLLDRPVPRIVVDVAGLRFCDSVGLSAFVTGHAAARDRGGWLRLAGPRQFLRILLDTLGLARYVTIHPDAAGAVAAD